MARGTSFGGIHSHTDLNLIQQKVEVEPAEPKMNLVEIPGADGAVDMTEQPAGRVTYKTRKITWTFALYPGENWDAKHRQVNNALNGRRCDITLDSDPEYYYQGRLAVKKHNVDGLLRQIVVEAICQPYKLRQDVTHVFVPFCGKNLLDVSEANQLSQMYGSVEYIPNGVRKSGPYFVGFPVYVKPNTLYYLSANAKKITEASAPANGGRIAIWDKDVRAAVASFGSFEGNRVFTFNSGNHTELSVLLYSDSDKTVGVYEFTNLQLEPLRATAYEPYTAQPEKEVILLNDRKPVVPTIVCSSATAIEVDGAIYSVNAGTHKILDLQLDEGETRVTLNGTGAASIIYQEGAL
jgi:hypothetical protein